MSKPKSRNFTLSKSTDSARTVDGFLNLTARLGLGAQNIISDSGYALDTLSKNRIKLETMYRTSWVVGAAIDSIAEDMVRAGVSIKSDDEPSRIEELQSALKRQGIWGALLDTIKWARLYGGSIALMIIDGQDPSTPLDIETVAAGQFKGLKVYDRWELQPDPTLS